MECLRKMEAKSNGSENRMPSIVEAGALAVATTVKDHSLTSKNNIESFHYDKKPRGVPKMPSPVNTNIQHNLNRTLVLMILFATSGFVIWNGENRRALYKKSAEEEEEEEKMLSSLFHDDNPTWCELYIKERDKNEYRKDVLKKWGELRIKDRDELSLDEFLKLLDDLLDAFTKEWKSAKPYYRPFHFFNSLCSINQLWKIYVEKDEIPGETSTDESKSVLDDVAKNIHGAKRIYGYMQKFSKKYPEFSNNYAQFKANYLDILQLDEKWYPRSILTLWEKKMRVKK